MENETIIDEVIARLDKIKDKVNDMQKFIDENMVK